MGCNTSTEVQRFPTETNTTNNHMSSLLSSDKMKTANTKGSEIELNDKFAAKLDIIDEDIFKDDELLQNNSLIFEKVPVVESNLNEAAIKIQAGFRGYKTRKEIKEMMKDEEKPKAKAAEKAATTIQAGYKGYKVRKEIKKQPDKSDSSSNEGSPKKVTPGSASDVLDAEIADIDLNDPDLEKAATKIQSTFRGYQSRGKPPKPE